MIGTIILQIISAIMLMKCYPKEKDRFAIQGTCSNKKSVKLHIKRFGIVYLSCFVIIALLMGIYSHNWAYHKMDHDGEMNLGLKYITYHREKGGREEYIPLSSYAYIDGPDMNAAGLTTTFLLRTGIILMCFFLGLYLFSLTHDASSEYSYGLGIFSGIFIIVAPLIWYYMAPVKDDYWHLGRAFYLVLGAGIVQIAITILYRSTFRNNMKDVDQIEVKPM